ncbi:MAG: dihydropteroate synthase [Anaerolineae bacterium]|nr:dihydropteroate synthase [Anaerolineae bacterium]
MKIIGEKINGTRKQVKQAVLDRDADFIRKLAQSQAEAGSAWIDVNAGTAAEREPDDLVWLVETVQAVTDVPLCLDSANPVALAAALAHVKKPPLINSISGETARLTGVLPLAAQARGGVIALAMDDKGIPAATEGRVAIIRRLIEATRAAGIPDEEVYVDPLVMTIGTSGDAARVALATVRAVKAEFPRVHFTSGLSNVSYGLPARSLINRAFLTLMLEAGLDTAILDPLDRELRKTLLAAEAVLGIDRHCLRYTRAYRAGLLE